ncbi:MAG: trehalose-phosphatase [Terriglobales bacterium]|jgi:trehalose-phosphatase
MDKLRDADKSLLLLDYDGTLAPFMIDRDRAVPYPGVRTLLQQIMRTRRVRVVLISGRPCGEVSKLLDLQAPPEIWGAHGWQRLLPDGSCTRFVMEDDDRDALAIASTWISTLGYAHLAERKQSGIAIHWRGLPKEDAGAICNAMESATLPSQCAQRMLLRKFNGGIELQLKTRTKATVIGSLLEESSAETPVAYVGDDQTDEDAFRALGSRGLRILIDRDLHPTHADILLRPPEELLDFLLRWLLACGGTQ